MPGKTKESALTKKELIGYIGPIFEELKGDVQDLKGNFTRLEDLVHKQGADIHEIKLEVRTALETTSSVLRHEQISDDYGHRIAALEKDVQVLKLASKR